MNSGEGDCLLQNHGETTLCPNSGQVDMVSHTGLSAQKDKIPHVQKAKSHGRGTAPQRQSPTGVALALC